MVLNGQDLQSMPFKTVVCYDIGYGYDIPISTYKNGFIGSLDLSSIDKLQTLVNKKKISKINRSLLYTLKQKTDINPVLMIYHLKKF